MADHPAATVQIDERYLAEWFGFGFRDLIGYLAKQAAFTSYLEEEAKLAANTLTFTPTGDGKVKISIDSKGQRAMSTTRDAKEVLQQLADSAGLYVTISEAAPVEAQPVAEPAPQPIGGETVAEPPVPGQGAPQ